MCMLVNNALSGGSQLQIRRTSTDLNFIYQYLELLAFSMLFVRNWMRALSVCAWPKGYGFTYIVEYNGLASLVLYPEYL